MPLFTPLSPSGRHARLAIFIFHRVLATTDNLQPGEPDVIRFERIVRFLRRAYTLLTVSDAAKKLADGTLPAAAACITFDDGYADNYYLAAPILSRYAAPATFFIATGYVDGGCMWNDRIIEALRIAPSGIFDLEDVGLGHFRLGDACSRLQACQIILPQLKYFAQDQRERVALDVAKSCGLGDDITLMMTTHQLRALQREGIEIGAHTDTHPILERIADNKAEVEIRHSKACLENILEKSVTAFAYPNGRPEKDYSFRHTEMVRKAGFLAAVSTEQAIATSASDRFQLPRFTPWDIGITRFVLRCGLALVQANGGRGAPAPSGPVAVHGFQEDKA